jgi:cytochrome c peroxidase
LKSKLVFFGLAVFIIAGSIFLESCRVEVMKPTTTLLFQTPQGFPQPVYNFSQNPLTEQGFQLGKKLFYDGILSADGNFACGSCHQPEAAFTTYDHDRSHGAHNSHTLRNAPGLFNLAWYTAFNQDGSATNLHTVYRNHINSHTEMGEHMGHVLYKLNRHSQYPQLFFNAFGDGQITEEKLFKALDQFVVSLVSVNSKYDRVKRGEDSFHPLEQSGYAVFQSKCASCHKEPLFTDFSYRNIGLPVDNSLQDHGRMKVTGDKSDSLKFRVASLRNVAATSYYTHDGRYSIFRQVIRHYRNGVQQSATLDPSSINGIQMTQAEEDQLVFFLRTLTDSAFINNPRFRQ